MADHGTTSSGSLQLVVVTPEETTLETNAQFVAVPLYDGELGIAPGRAPMIGRLGYGELRFTADGKTTRYYVDGGFVQVLNNVVTVLTGRAIPAAKIDREVAAEQLRTALVRPANTPETLAIRDRLVTQARAQLRLAGQSGTSVGTAH